MRTNLVKSIIVSITLVFASRLCLSQGFVNLDFESANIPNGTQPPSFIPISNAFPGWDGFFSNTNGITQATGVAYDGFSLGSAVISIFDTNVAPGFVPFQGNYTAALFGGLNTATSISQTGLVPSGTKALLADIYAPSGPLSVSVTLGGQTISMIPLQIYSNFTLYGGDISAFAGQVSQLTFTSLAGGQPHELLLDNIQFSPSTIPEPSVFGLLALGGLFFGLRHPQARKT